MEQPKVTVNYATVDPDPTWESLVSQGMELAEAKAKIQWSLGDLALLVESKFGEDSLGKFAAEIGINRMSLYNYRWVAKTYSLEVRQEFRHLSFAHFVLAAKHENSKDILAKASDEQYSAETLGAYLKSGQDQNFRPLKKLAKPDLAMCDTCEGWYIVGDNTCKVKGDHSVGNGHNIEV